MAIKGAKAVDPKAPAATEAKVDPKAEAKAAAKDAAEKLKAAKEQEKKDKEANKAKLKEEAEKAKAAAEEEKAKAAEKRKAEAEERKALKAGPAKLLKSLIARIKYMRYMDSPSSPLEGVENLGWALTLTNSKGTIYGVERGSSVDEINYSVKETGKKAVTGACGINDEALEELVGGWEA